MRQEAEKHINDRLKALGFDSLADYLAARIGVPYPTLADELGDSVLGMHLAALHVRRAKDCRAAAADALVRVLRQVLTKGWDLTDASEAGVSREFVNGTAWTYWAAMLDRCAPSEEVLEAIWEHIKANARTGWLPATPDDPIIAEAFRSAWPRTR